jgi:FAD/FMN-containing dehydrogenase
MDRLGVSLPGQVSTPAMLVTAPRRPFGQNRSGACGAVVHRQTAHDVQSVIRAARDCGLPLSVRGGVSR